MTELNNRQCEIKRIIRDYYEQLYGNKVDNLEEMMLKLKLQYFGHLMRRVDSLEKTLMLGGIGVRRRRDDRG